MLSGAEAWLAAAVTTLGELTSKVSAVQAAFELKGTAVAAVAEELEARLEAARGWLGIFAWGVAEDVAQYTLGLVKSHFPKADLEPVGDAMAPETSGLVWAD